ncbi:MAG: hypothetical protein F4Y79_17380 [Gemmatimonadetes bacterium]|nr:hypothetical protein [Gemmatimonadota bacterium]
MAKKKKRRRRPLHKVSEIPSDIVQPPWAWSHLLAGSVVLLLSYVALLGGFSDGVVVTTNLFTGDFWFFQEIYNDIFIRGLSSDGIRTGVAPMYFPCMVLWFALAAMFPPDVVWFLCGFLLHALGAAGWILVCRRLGAGPLAQGAVPLAYAVQILLLAYGENELFLPAIVLIPIHSGTWSAVPWLLWTCLGYSRAKVCLLFGLLTLIAASDLTIVPWFIAPAFLTIILQWWRKIIPSRPAAIWLVILTAATLLGYVIHLTIGPFEKGLNTGKFLTLRLESLITNLVTFLHFMGVLGRLYWHLVPIWILFFVLWIRFGWVVLSQSRDGTRSFAAIFIVASVIATPSAMVVAGLVSSPDTIIAPFWYAFESRYMFPVLFFPLFAGWPLLVVLSGWSEKIKPQLRRWLPVSLVIIATVSAVIKIWRLDYQRFAPFQIPYAVCLRDIANRLEWTGGISVWGFLRNAVVDPENPISRALPVENVSILGDRFFDYPLIISWDANNRHHFTGDFQVVVIDNFQGKRFVVEPRAQSDSCQTPQCVNFSPTRSLNEDVVRSVFGEPAQIFECEGVGLFYYDPPIRLNLEHLTRGEQFPVPLRRRKSTSPKAPE